MSVSDEERERLHLMLDALINARTTLERIDPDNLERPFRIYQWWRPRQELFNNASVFLRTAIGKKLFEQEMSLLFESDLLENSNDAFLLANLTNAIRSFLPLFMKEGRYEDFPGGQNIEKFIQDFMGIYWGDEPRFFAIIQKRQGQHKRPYRLARLRLAALNWDKYLASVGVSTKDRHNLISQAYRTDWDAIRKWAKSVDEQFDLKSYPPRDLETAIRDFNADPDFVYERIAKDGDEYWRELQSAKTGKDF